MTVIVGVRGKKGVLLAADSVATSVSYGDQRENRNGKAHLLTETVGFACCGSPRVSQLIRFMNVPALPLGEDEYRWAVTTFIPALRKHLEDAGALRNNAGELSVAGGSMFLLAVRDRLFEVYPDLQVDENEWPWAVGGSGGDGAAGSLQQQLGDRTDPVEDDKTLAIGRAAVAAGIALNAFCGGKIVHVRTKRFTAAEKKLAEEVLA